MNDDDSGLPGAGDCADGDFDCREALERIYEFMDGELPDADRRMIEEHFEKCAACYPHLAMEKNFRNRVAAAISRQECPEELRRRVMSILDGESAGS